MQQMTCELRKRREKWGGQLEALQRGPNSQPTGKASGHGHFLPFLFLIFFNIFYFFILSLKIKLCVMEWGYKYCFIWWAKFVSLAVQKIRVASLKFGSQTDVVVAEPTSKPNFWLTIAFALICSIGLYRCCLSHPFFFVDFFHFILFLVQCLHLTQGAHRLWLHFRPSQVDKHRRHSQVSRGGTWVFGFCHQHATLHKKRCNFFVFILFSWLFYCSSTPFFNANFQLTWIRLTLWSNLLPLLKFMVLHKLSYMVAKVEYLIDLGLL